MMQKVINKIARIFGLGRITQVNDSGVTQMLQIKLNEQESRDDTIRFAEYGFSSNPPVGTDCVLISFGGERNASMIIATNNQTHRFKNLASGESVLFDDKGQSVYLTASGLKINGGGFPISISNASSITLNAEESVTFNAPIATINSAVTFTQDVSISPSASFKHGDADIGFKHTHGGVQAGNGSTGEVNV